MAEDVHVVKHLAEIYAHVEATWPSEGCGVILEGPNGTRVRPLVNAYDRYHAVDPEAYPRTSKTAYEFDGKQWLQLNREIETTGERIACVFHSHCDVGAYFSAEDKRAAAPDGQPLLPGTIYLVVDVQRGRALGAKAFVFQAGDFVEVPIGA